MLAARLLSPTFLLRPKIECKRVYRQSVAAQGLCQSVAATVQPVQREESGFGVAGLEAEAIQSRTVVVAAGESCSPELGAASEFEHVLGYQLESGTALVELSDEHLAVVGLAGAGSRHWESP